MAAGKAKQCDVCAKNEAVMKVRQVDKDGNASELSICVECAQKRGLTKVEELKTNVAELLDEMKGRIEAKDSKALCPRCGMSYADFKRQGRVGCAQCYTAFHDQLVPVLRRLHSAAQHVGKTTSTGRKAAQERLTAEWLRGELKKAVDGEDYERAATLRDQLRGGGSETGE
jgi:protein arginine kinase activator